MSAGEIVVGTTIVALEHVHRSLMDDINKNPLLVANEATYVAAMASRKREKPPKAHNPENARVELLRECSDALRYSEIAYYPSIYLSKKEKQKGDSAVAPQNDATMQKSDSKTTVVASAAAIADIHKTRDLELEYICSIDQSAHFVTAYVLMRDDVNKRFCLLCRGSNSVSDLLTDFSPTPIKFQTSQYYDEVVRPAGRDCKISGVVHEGVLQAALAVFRHCRHSLVKQLSLLPDYSIFTCGHSIGGSVASVLAILLREQFGSGAIWREIEGVPATVPPPMPRIRCIAFAPSSVLSYDLSVWCKKFVTSFILGGDIVPRLSPNAGERLRLEIINSRWESKVADIKQTILKNVTEQVSGKLQSWGIKPPSFLSGWGSSNANPAAPENVAPPSQAEPAKPDQPQLDFDKKCFNPDIQEMLPPGDIYLFVELRGPMVEMLTTTELANSSPEKEALASPKPTGLTAATSPQTTTTSEPGSPSLKQSMYEQIVAILLQREEQAEEDERRKSQLQQKTRTRTRHRRFTLRQVDAKHFDRIIFNSWMLEDHKLAHYYDAFSYLLHAEEQYERHVARTQAQDRYVQASVLSPKQTAIYRR